MAVLGWKNSTVIPLVNSETAQEGPKQVIPEGLYLYPGISYIFGQYFYRDRSFASGFVHTSLIHSFGDMPVSSGYLFQS
jgi:hypothetical protein